MSEAHTRTRLWEKYLPALLFSLVAVVVVLVRIRLFQVPLERDEGEYAYIAQLLLKGIPPYSHAYSLKLPGVSYLYALFILLGGPTASSIHLGLLFVNGLCVWLVFLLARRILDPAAAFFSCTAYAILSLSQSVHGVFAHATHGVVLFSLAGFVFLFVHLDSGRRPELLCGGLCFGMAFLMKQHAIVLVGFAGLFLLWQVRKKSPGRACLLFATAVLVPYVLVALHAVVSGVAGKFWFWTFEYARSYVSEMSLEQGWDNFSGTFGNLLLLQLPFWLLAIAGMVLLFAKERFQSARAFLSGLFGASVLAVCPGMYFREHYFIMLLPVTALLVGVAASCSGEFLGAQEWRTLRKGLPVILVLAATGYSLFVERAYYFFQTPRQVSRAIYGTNPFPEAVAIAGYLKEHSTVNDRIAILGSEPEIFFYSGRISASGHIYMYGLMEDQPYAEAMQREMIREIETEHPKFLVMVNVAESWGKLPSSNRLLLDWCEHFITEQYDITGWVDIRNPEPTHFVWDGAAAGYSPVSNSFLSVYKRKNS